jgi:hypothetical protein
MSLFQLTKDGDRARDEFGLLPRVEGAEEATTHVTTRLRIIKGEVFRDTRLGLDSFDFIFRPQTSAQAIANHIASLIGDTPGITEPEVQLTFSKDGTGRLDVGWDAKFSADDLVERSPIHDTIQITNEFGGVT